MNETDRTIRAIVCSYIYKELFTIDLRGNVPKCHAQIRSGDTQPDRRQRADHRGDIRFSSWSFVEFLTDHEDPTIDNQPFDLD